MDMSFANQALSVEYMLGHHGGLSNTVHGVPEPIDREIARLKLRAAGVRVDRLTGEQRKYLTSWEMGT
jgi:adenosylhomocysteinase